MEQAKCVVCGDPATSAAATRPYCSRHLGRLGAWWRRTGQATAVMILGLVAFVLIASWLAPSLRGALDRDGRTVAGIVLAFVPAALWLSVFYLQDRERPEPKVLLLKVFALGGIAAAAIGHPVIYRLFLVSEWAGESLVVRIATGILVVGAVQEFVKYAAVRHSVYGSSEYDEPIDGIVYAAAAGLGYAAVQDVIWVVDNAGADLGVAAWHSTIDALAQASFAGVAGYFLGRAKFERRGASWMPLGLLLACVLNGVVSTALGALSRSGLDVTPGRGLAFAAVVAGVTFAALLYAMRGGTRSPEVGGRVATTEAAVPSPSTGAPRREWLVVGVVLAMLAAGWGLRSTLYRGSRLVTATAVTIELPRSWVASIDESTRRTLVASEPLSALAYPTEISVRRRPVAKSGEGPQDLDALAAQRAMAPDPEESGSYTVVSTRRATAAGRVPALLVEYGYVASSRTGAPVTALPVVVRAQDLMFRLGDAWVVVTFAAEAGRFAEDRWIWDRALGSLRLPMGNP